MGLPVWSALGDTLPLAAGIALSPVGMIICLVMLMGVGGRRKAAVFGLGWFVSVLVVAGVAYFIVEAADTADAARAILGVEGLQLLLALVCFGLAGFTFRRGPASGQSRESRLLQRLDTITVRTAAGLGLAQGFARIKNIFLAFGAGARLGEAGLPRGEGVFPLAVFALLSTSGVLVPLIIAVVNGRRVPTTLVRSREWLEANMSTITIVALLVVGVYFLGQGLDILD